MAQSNYEITKKKAQGEFLEYDQEHIIRKFQLEHDDDYLYIRFAGRDYRIDRRTGKVEWSEDGFGSAAEAGYDETLSIFDILCYSKDGCCLSGRFGKINSVKGTTRRASAPGNELFHPSAQYFDHRMGALCLACERLGGIREKVGDVSYRIPVFDFLPVILQFWESDEEFPASLQLMWDENILDYMHFETTFYVASHLLCRLRELMETI